MPSMYEKTGSILQNVTEVNNSREALEAVLNPCQLGLELYDGGEYKPRVVFRGYYEDDSELDGYHRMARLDELLDLEARLGNLDGRYLPLEGGAMDVGAEALFEAAIETTWYPVPRTRVAGGEVEISLTGGAFSANERAILATERLRIHRAAGSRAIWGDHSIDAAHFHNDIMQNTPYGDGRVQSEARIRFNNPDPSTLQLLVQSRQTNNQSNNPIESAVWTDVQDLLNPAAFSLPAHTHEMSDVDGLVAELAGYVKKTGDTMTGALTINYGNLADGSHSLKAVSIKTDRIVLKDLYTGHSVPTAYIQEVPNAGMCYYSELRHCFRSLDTNPARGEVVIGVGYDGFPGMSEFYDQYGYLFFNGGDQNNRAAGVFANDECVHIWKDDNPGSTGGYDIRFHRNFVHSTGLRIYPDRASISGDVFLDKDIYWINRPTSGAAYGDHARTGAVRIRFASGHAYLETYNGYTWVQINLNV